MPGARQLGPHDLGVGDGLRLLAGHDRHPARERLERLAVEPPDVAVGDQEPAAVDRARPERRSLEQPRPDVHGVVARALAAHSTLARAGTSLERVAARAPSRGSARPGRSRRPARRRPARARRTGARSARGRAASGRPVPRARAQAVSAVDVEPDDEVLGQRARTASEPIAPPPSATTRGVRRVEQLERDALLLGAGTPPRRPRRTSRSIGLPSRCSITASTSTASSPSASAALARRGRLARPHEADADDQRPAVEHPGPLLSGHLGQPIRSLVGAQRAADVVDVVAAELLPVGVGEHERHHRLADHAGRRHRARVGPLAQRLRPARGSRCRPSAAAWSASAAASSSRARRAARRSSSRPPPRRRGWSARW